MNYYALWLEITQDPASLGYGGKTALQAAAMLSAGNQEVPRTTITGAELWENTVLDEYKALSDAERSVYWGLAGFEAIDVMPSTNSRAALAQLFPAGSDTRANLLALVQTPLLTSRATILELGYVLPEHVRKAWVQGQRGDFD